jgi:hypothetical protein
MRLAEAGPKWDTTPTPADAAPEAAVVDLAALEAELDDVAEHRPALQAQARTELTQERLPLTPHHRHRPGRADPPPLPTGGRMTTTPLPLADPPRATARPPGPRETEDHKPQLSGGARCAFGVQMRPRARLRHPAADRARSMLLHPVKPGGREQ